ncbi:sulfatase-like hydrolase/transferase [Pelagibacterium sediminicola]|uniref:sulfatase-like hydrolase/transferase n=1 Tax=Pelagibacterium sediminicola TaxID=2248761 RepID=UPI000E310F07|nr:sulfatase-like hydrolase/transferase [Pelagibacterium sediminicola]
MLNIIAYILIGANAILIIVTSISNQFTGDGINDAAIFQMTYGLAGVDLLHFWEVTAAFIISIAALFVTLFLIHRRFKRMRPLTVTLVSSALLIALVANPSSARLYQAISASYSSTVNAIHQTESGKQLNFDELFVVRPIERPSTLKNLVYIYAEGLDRRFFDSEAFHDLLPALVELEQSAVSYKNVSSSSGTGWTIGGIVGSQCGIPLWTPSGEGNLLAGYGSFLPLARCLGDELASHGYDLRFIQGATLDFAGKGNFFNDHGFAQVLGKEQLTEPGEPLSGWGRFDEFTFATARQHLNDLQEGDDPFGLFLLTLDTHPPSGYPSPSCGRSRIDTQMLDTLRCADQMLASFIRDILESESAENTMVVLSSDHPMMPNELSDQLSGLRGTNTFMIWNGKQESISDDIAHRAATTLDIGATVAAALGFQTDRLGLGVNLSSSEPTLVEEAGSLHEMNGALRAWAPIFRQLWMENDPARSRIRLADGGAYVEVGAQRLRTPVVFDFDRNGDFRGVYFGTTTAWFTQLLAQGDSPAYVGPCANIHSILFKPAGDLDVEGTCLSYRSPDGDLYFQHIIEGDVFSVRHNPQAILTDNLQEFAELRVGFYLENKTIPEAYAQSTSPVHGIDFHISSTGYGQPEPTQLIVGSSAAIPLRHRGLNIVSVDETGGAELIGSIDTCGPQLDQPTIRDFWRREQSTETLLVVVHDSAQCGNDIDWAVDNLPLDGLRSIEFRQPYIAVISEDHVKEFKGVRGHPLLVRLSHADQVTH